MARTRWSLALQNIRRPFWPGLALLALVTVACIPQGVRVPESPLLRNLERKSGLIGYVGLDGNIYTIDQGGSNQRAVTTNAILSREGGDSRFYQFPTWSPDSQRLAFVSFEQHGGERDLKLYTAAPDGSQLIEAFSSSSETPFYLFWSPDSRHVSFLASRGTANLVLKVVEPGSGEARIVDTGQPYYWDWSPDGERLLVHVGGAAQGHLAFLTLGQEVIEEGLNLRPTLFQAPAWSPKGDRLLLAISEGDNEGVLVMTDVSGNVLQELTRFRGPTAFAWSHDGERLAYISDARLSQLGILGPLRVIHPARPDEPTKTEEDLVVAFFWSPDNSRIAYFVPVVVQSDESSESTQPDLLHAVYVLDVETGKSERLAVFRPTNEFMQVLPFFDQYHHSITIWSPDSRNLVLSGFDSNGVPGIWTIPANGELDARFITEGLVGFWSWK